MRPWWCTGRTRRVSSAYRQIGQCAACRASRRVWDLSRNRAMAHPALQTHASEDRTHLHRDLWPASHSWESRARTTSTYGRAFTAGNALFPSPAPLASRTSVSSCPAWASKTSGSRCYVSARRAAPRASRCASRSGRRTFRPSVTCSAGRRIAYFNDLRLPLTTEHDVLESGNHWFDRVWTLQKVVPRMASRCADWHSCARRTHVLRTATDPHFASSLWARPKGTQGFCRRWKPAILRSALAHSAHSAGLRRTLAGGRGVWPTQVRAS